MWRLYESQQMLGEAVAPKVSSLLLSVIQGIRSGKMKEGAGERQREDAING